MTVTSDERVVGLSVQVAEEIRAMLGRKRMSQAHLARALGVSAMWISDRLRGVQPIDLNDLERIARALQVPVGSLLPGSINDGSARLTVRPSRTHPRGRSASERTRPVSPVPPTLRRPRPIGTDRVSDAA